MGDRINLLKDHGKKVGLPTELFEYGHKEHKVFGVRTLDFRSVVPALLVKILGTRGSPKTVRVV